MSLLLTILVIAIAVTIVRRLPKNNCNQDCNQGRCCNCGEK